MKIKQFLFFIFFLSITQGYSQKQAQAQIQVVPEMTFCDVQYFAAQQNELFVQAYNQRDVEMYGKLLEEFLAKYNNLSGSDKKNFSGFLGGIYYNFCCTYSLLNNKKMALTYLQKSIAEGYKDYEHMQKDIDLHHIRKEKEFKGIINQLRNSEKQNKEKKARGNTTF